MMVEIPDPDVIFSVMIAFLVGLGSLHLYYKIRPLIKIQKSTDSANKERLEYYEKQLIDMKIRLDVLDMQERTQEPKLDTKLGQSQAGSTGNPTSVESPEKGSKQVFSATNQPTVPKFEHGGVVEYVLHLITKNAMTSRDIQVTLKRSREHTSRLMKKLFEDGYVQRTLTKPYAYSITEKGKEKIQNV